MKPNAVIVSEFGEEMKTIWIKAVRLLGKKIAEIVPKGIPIFAGDPVLIYNIVNHRFLCHEDQQFHAPEELRMVGIHQVQTNSPSGPTRPYLFRLESHFEDESDYEDKVRDFHDKLTSRSLPHFREGPETNSGRNDQ